MRMFVKTLRGRIVEAAEQRKCRIGIPCVGDRLKRADQLVTRPFKCVISRNP